ncbi:MAG: TMEM165/GDT1 family protein [Chloroflexi bacterium]|nr:TMEM165/GDT1 family protein [Chloroflexota bacterium]
MGGSRVSLSLGSRRKHRRWRLEAVSAFWQSLVFITLAEMGDKTQFVSLAFATRFSATTVLGGILVATLLVHLLSVSLGELLGLALPSFWIALAAGLAFVGFGAWTLRGDSLGDEERKAAPRFGPFLTVAVTFFLAELGDKTMLATVTLASQFLSFVPVWLGSSLGMVLADGVAILVGLAAGRRLPERAIRYAAATIFILSGVLTMADALLRGPVATG